MASSLFANTHPAAYGALRKAHGRPAPAGLMACFRGHASPLDRRLRVIWDSYLPGQPHKTLQLYSKLFRPVAQGVRHTT